MIEHKMIWKKTFPDGSELWVCPNCERQIIISKDYKEHLEEGVNHSFAHLATSSKDVYIEMLDEDYEEMMRDWNESV